MTRKLGPAQADFLGAMLRRGGEWHADCGWYAGSPSVTEKLCRALERRGLLRSEDIQSSSGATLRWSVVDPGVAARAVKLAGRG